MKSKKISQMIVYARNTILNLSQEELAAKLNITQQRIAQYENPKTKNQGIGKQKFLELAALANQNVEEWEEIYELEKIKTQSSPIYNKYIVNDDKHNSKIKIADNSECYSIKNIPFYTLPTDLKIFNVEVVNMETLNGKWLLTCENRPPKDDEWILISINDKAIFTRFNKTLHNSNNIIFYPVVNLKPII